LIRPSRRALAAAALALLAAGAQADSARFCDRPKRLAAQEQDRLLRVAALVRQELQASGAEVALVARSGQDLARFGKRYSHAGLSLAASPNTPWSVRQLYFDCDEGYPRLFDQGIAGFVLGNDNAQLGYVSIVLMPAAAAEPLARRALDNAAAMRLLAANYSANAYPFSVRYQNCNQWVAELLAAAWGGLPDGDDLRARAQDWLHEAGYRPEVFQAGSGFLMIAALFVPWLHHDDHPLEDRAALRYRVSMPESIEALVRERVPGARRLEICHDGARVVVHEGWDKVAEGCVAGPQDRQLTLD
jgi:hypothetical protein